MKKKRLIPLLSFCLVILLISLGGCGVQETNAPPASSSPSGSAVSASGGETAPAGTQAYTIMIYMNGSDLESDYGAATADITEMLESGYDAASMNIVLYTGGTTEWKNNTIPNDANCIWKIEDDALTLLKKDPPASMGDPDTLASFLEYAYTACPAQSYGLVFWDHGGGPVMGYGCDHLFNDDSLSLSEIKSALSGSPASEPPLTFIGFDACLMGSIETAYTVSDYADYLVASEEIVPNCGWDYHSLGQISKTPGMDGAEIGTILVDGFADFYAANIPDEQATLSVLDLSQTETALTALSSFSQAAEGSLENGNFATLAHSRNDTKSFGSLGDHSGEFDLADIVDLATQMESSFPAEASALIDSVSSMVVYNRTSDNIENANGLSVYFPYLEKDHLSTWIPAYDEIGFLSSYTEFVNDFSDTLAGEDYFTGDQMTALTPKKTADGDYQITLTREDLDNIVEIYFTVWRQAEDGSDYFIKLGESSDVSIDQNGTITTEFDGYWTGLNGSGVCIYELDHTDTETRYTIPALLNGEEVDLIALYSTECPEGKIIGAMPVVDDESGMPAKQLLPIGQGDTITLLYYAEQFSDENGVFDESLDPYTWYEGDAFTVDGDLVLEDFEVTHGDYLYGFYIVDAQQNGHDTDFIEVSYE
jgi:hypothetical protein